MGFSDKFSDYCVKNAEPFRAIDKSQMELAQGVLPGFVSAFEEIEKQFDVAIADIIEQQEQVEKQIIESADGLTKKTMNVRVWSDENSTVVTPLKF